MADVLEESGAYLSMTDTSDVMITKLLKSEADALPVVDEERYLLGEVRMVDFLESESLPTKTDRNNTPERSHA